MRCFRWQANPGYLLTTYPRRLCGSCDVAGTCDTVSSAALEVQSYPWLPTLLLAWLVIIGQGFCFAKLDSLAK